MQILFVLSIEWSMLNEYIFLQVWFLLEENIFKEILSHLNMQIFGHCTSLLVTLSVISYHPCQACIGFPVFSFLCIFLSLNSIMCRVGISSLPLGSLSTILCVLDFFFLATHSRLWISINMGIICLSSCLVGIPQ